MKREKLKEKKKRRNGRKKQHGQLLNDKTPACLPSFTLNQLQNNNNNNIPQITINKKVLTPPESPQIPFIPSVISEIDNFKRHFTKSMPKNSNFHYAPLDFQQQQLEVRNVLSNGKKKNSENDKSNTSFKKDSLKRTFTIVKHETYQKIVRSKSLPQEAKLAPTFITHKNFYSPTNVFPITQSIDVHENKKNHEIQHAKLKV